MQHKPRRLLRDAESATHLIRAKSIAAIHEHPQSDKPLVQSDRRILENRSDLDGELLCAFLALPSLLRGKIVVLAMTALRTDRAIGPAQLGNRVNAGLFVLKVPDGISESFGLVHLSRPLLKTVAGARWLVKYIITEHSAETLGGDCLCDAASDSAAPRPCGNPDSCS